MNKTTTNSQATSHPDSDSDATVDRRRFLKLAGVAVAGAALPSWVDAAAQPLQGGVGKTATLKTRSLGGRRDAKQMKQIAQD